MISQLVYPLIKAGTHIYEVSSENKTCNPGIVIGKTVNPEKSGFKVKLYDGRIKYVDHVNGVEEDDAGKPGWYVMF
jgi:hypothetical protein